MFYTAHSAGFTYRLDRLKPRASQFRGPPAKVCDIFNSVIGLSHLCCRNILYFLNNPSVIFLTQLHSISEYCRILNTPHHLCLYWNWLNTLQTSAKREEGVLRGASQVVSLETLYLNPSLTSHDLLDCRQLYVYTSHFCHAHADLAIPS